jgi:hypothetical protein
MMLSPHLYCKWYLANVDLFDSSVLQKYAKLIPDFPGWGSLAKCVPSPGVSPLVSERELLTHTRTDAARQFVMEQVS